jgi:hypothetical protein
MTNLEFSLLGNKDENLIKIIATGNENTMFLELLTKTSSLHNQSIVVELTTDELLEIIVSKYNEVKG